jgi:hypothetical protein
MCTRRPHLSVKFKYAVSIFKSKQILKRGYIRGSDMAKKKAKKSAAPSRKESGNSMGWVIAAIVVIVIIAFLVLRPGREGAMEKKEGAEQPTAPAGGLQQTTAPEFNKKCTVPNSPTGPTIGIVPGTLNDENGVVTVTFKNNGRVAIEGTYFEFSDVKGSAASGKTIFRKNTDVVEPSKTITYTVDLNQVGTELGAAVDTFTIYPIQDGKACENSRVFVINYAE